MRVRSRLTDSRSATTSRSRSPPGTQELPVPGRRSPTLRPAIAKRLSLEGRESVDRAAYCRSYTATEPAAVPCASVGVSVIVMVLLWFETTTLAVIVGFPPLFQTFS